MYYSRSRRQWNAPVAGNQGSGAADFRTAGRGSRRGWWPWAVFAAAVAVLVAAGCSNTSVSPDAGQVEEDPYPLRTGPSNVLQKLNEAYVAMDVEAYLDCLAEDFEFVLDPGDVNDPGNDLPPSWGKQAERDIHERMFSDTTNVDRIDLALTDISIDYDQGADPSDPADDRLTYLEQPDLRVVIGYWTYITSHEQEFVFMVDPDTTGPNGEALWEIVEWHEIDERSCLEDSSWGSIKALYR